MMMETNNLYIPLIGITPSYSYNEEKVYISQECMKTVKAAGGLGVLLPLTDDELTIIDCIKRFDGFLISGGPDVDGRHYGENNLVHMGEISPLRDTMEINITKKAFIASKPILGICRGMQVLNVAMGGTLYQDINEQIKCEAVLKHHQEAPKWHPIHEIYIEEGSIMQEAYGKCITLVNSFHHQAVKKVAPEFMATSKAADGIIESIEYIGLKTENNLPSGRGKEKQFAVGVQWHPETMWERYPIHLKIFKHFIYAAKHARNVVL